MTIVTDFTHLRAVVTGATNQIGYFLIPQLRAAGFTQIEAYSRRFHPPESRIHWQQVDLSTTVNIPITQPTIWFHAAPLMLLPRLLSQLPQNVPLIRILAFSSTSRISKLQSSDLKERRVAHQLADAEHAVMTLSQQRGIPWTLFRPTLIYGCQRDKNISFIAQFIRRFRFFPLLGQGTGLRQPVHAEDLARACLHACQTSATYNKTYNLSGGQTLSYREMLETIFHHLGQKPRIISIPPVIFKWLVRSVRGLPAYAHLSTAMLTRINEDLHFEHTAATQDFGYQPRRFSDADLGF